MAANVITRLTLEHSQFDKAVIGAKKQIGDFAESALSVKGIMAGIGGVAAFAGISAGLSDVVKKSMEFEKSLSNMKALTGAAGEQLEYFKDEAIRLGSTTTQTASEVVEAFKLIGSKKAELLGNKEALVDVTEAAIVLAEAAGITVPEAANALAGALNQFGESSSHAKEYINILAAASQKGAADINYLNTAIEKSGGTASSVGVKFDQLVAAIEAIAPKITDAGMAGTTLRNILLSLEKQSDEKIKPSIVGLAQSVQNLADKHLTATEMVKLFGKENVTSAMALVSAKDAMLELNEAIVGTNTAYEQQAANTDNLEGSIKGLQSAWEGFVLTLNGSSGILKEIVDSLTEAVTQAKELLMDQDKLHQQKMNSGTKNDKDMAKERVEQRVASGMTVQEAYDAEKKNIGYMYSTAGDWDSGAAQKRLQAAKDALVFKPSFKKGQSTGWTAERAKELQEAEKAYKQAEHDWYGYQAAMSSLDSWLDEQTAPAVEPTKASSAAATSSKKTKASKKQQVTPEMIASVNTGLNYDTELGDKYMQYVENGELPVVKLPVVIEEEIEDDGVVDSILDGQIKKMEDFKTTINNVGDAAGYMSQMFGSAASAMRSIGEDDMAALFSIAGNVAQAIQQYSSLAIAAATAQASMMAFPFNLAAIATSVSMITGIISSLNYAEGGIVPGTNYQDGIVARVSSGEMFINSHDQKQLYDQIHSGNIGGGGGGRTVVSGEQLVTVINNYGRRTGRGEILR